MIGELTNHLWQSTVFAVVVVVLTFVFRKNRAQVRYGLWFSVSLKFFIPFSLLMALGRQLDWAPPPDSFAAQIATPSVSYTVEQITQPFPGVLPSVPGLQRNAVAATPEWVPWVILGVWACGFIAIALVRLGTWRRIRAAVHDSTPLEVQAGEIGILNVRSCPGLLEPAVVGLLRPILLLPMGIVDRLTPPQLKAVLAHELCHVRRRDNLTAAIHMIVEAVFWFHPLVWWIGTRLVEERERACDEEVVRLGNEPQTYAEGILNVCKFYQESPLVCMSGVTGSNLRKRVEDIMRNRVASKLSVSKMVLLTIGATAALVVPVVAGVVSAVGRAPLERSFRSAANPAELGAFPPAQPQATVQGRTSPVPSGTRDAFEVTSIRPSTAVSPGPGGPLCRGGVPQVDPERFFVADATTLQLITWAYGIRDCRHEVGMISGGPDWIRQDRYEVEARIPAGASTYRRMQLTGGDAPQLQRMLQTMLRERFKLSLRRETREMPVFELVVEHPGKIQLSGNQSSPPDPFDPFAPGASLDFDPGGAPPPGTLVLFMGNGVLQGTQISMPLLVQRFQASKTRLVIDKTGLKGVFDLRVPVSLAPATTTSGVPPDTDAQVLDYLGLKLESSRAPVEVFIIESIDRPSDN